MKKITVLIIITLIALVFALSYAYNQFLMIGPLPAGPPKETVKKIIAQLDDNNKRIYFHESDIIIKKAESRVLTVGIKNINSAPVNYKMRFTPISGPDGAPFSIDNPSWFQFAQNQVYTLGAAETDIRSIKLTISRSVPAGSYFLTFEIINNDLTPPNDIYAKEDINILVN